MLKEKDIRPRLVEEKICRLRRQEIISAFLDKNGEAVKDYFIEINCPACGKSKNSKEFAKEGFIFKRCSYCNTLFVSPRPKPFKLLEYYKYSKSVEVFTREILEETAVVRKNKIFLPRAKKVIFYLDDLSVSRNLLVEIGGGNGLFLEAMKEMGAGFKKYLNVEASKEGCKLTKSRGFDALNDFIENAKSLRADCVCAFEVIEHLFDPLRFFKQVKKILNKDGILIISVPNIEGFDLMLLGKDSDNVAAPNHLNYFNPKSIEILLKKAGLKRVSLETPGVLDVDIVRNKILSGYKINDVFVSFLMKKENNRMREEFQSFLQNSNLSSNMWVVCKNAK